MANQKMNNELDLNQLGKVSGGHGGRRKSAAFVSPRGQYSQFLPPIDAEFGFKIPDGKCGLHEVIDADGNCVPASEL